jgi:hypothetical protein
MSIFIIKKLNLLNQIIQKLSSLYKNMRLNNKEMIFYSIKLEWKLLLKL